MATGRVDGSVKDRARGELILSLLLPVVRPGSVVRVGSKTIKVDKSRCVRQNKEEGDAGESGGQTAPGA